MTSTSASVAIQAQLTRRVGAKGESPQLAYQY
jgi:hypothetical protein